MRLKRQKIIISVAAPNVAIKILSASNFFYSKIQMKNKFVGKPKFLIFALIVALIANFPVANEIALSKDYDDDEHQIFELVNAQRRRSRLNDLIWDDKLARMARSFSKKMAKENFFAHADFDGKTVVDHAEDSSVKDWRKIGENLFYFEGNYNFDELAVKSWMKSSSHRQNILDENWTVTSIGIAESRAGRIYITQVFIED